VNMSPNLERCNLLEVKKIQFRGAQTVTVALIVGPEGKAMRPVGDAVDGVDGRTCFAVRYTAHFAHWCTVEKDRVFPAILVSEESECDARACRSSSTRFMKNEGRFWLIAHL